jgi:zinc protease
MARGLTGALGVAALACLGSCASSPPRTELAPGAALSAADEEALRAHPPPIEAARRFYLPDAYVATLANGLRLVVFERHALRVVSAELVLPGGVAAAHEPPAIVQLMVNTLTAGTQRRNEPSLYVAMNLNLIQLHPHVNNSWLGFNVRAPAASFDQALSLLHDVALEPTFPATAVEVVRRRMTGIESAHVDQPARAAQRNFFAALFGPQDPYTLEAQPQARDLESAGRDQVVAAWRDLMIPAGATLIVAGDVNPLVVRQSVATLFGGWAPDAAARPRVPVAASVGPVDSARIIVVDRPGAPHATIFYGGRAPADPKTGEPDLPAQQAASAVVQELVDRAESRAKSSRTTDEPGPTWTARRRLPARALWWEKTVAPDRVGAAVRQLDEWLTELRDRGPDASELRHCRASVGQRIVTWFETIERITESFADYVGAGLPLDWISRFADSLTAQPWERARDVLPRPEQMRLVVVGDLMAVIPQLLALKRGPVEVHDADGRLLRTFSR